MALCVIVTRPQPQADAWVRRLRDAGIDARPLPLIDIRAVPDAYALREAWAGLSNDAMAVFVSPNAATQFFAGRVDASAWPPDVLAACTGPGTAAALADLGVPPRLIAQPPADAQFDSEALWCTCLAQRDWHGRTVLIVRGDGGRDWLADTLAANGAAVRFVQAYTRTIPALGDDERRLLGDALARPQDHLWLFSSSQAIAHLNRLSPGTDWHGVSALATHPRIAQSARALGMQQVHEAPPTEQGILAALSTLSART